MLNLLRATTSALALAFLHTSASQAAQALERTRLAEAEARLNAPKPLATGVN